MFGVFSGQDVRRPGGLLWPSLAFLFLWVLAAMIVGFSGEFSQNDDFAYIWTLRKMLSEGTFERTSWTWVPILSSTAWGALFAKMFGDSVAVLRFSSWFAAGLGGLALLRWMHEAGVKPSVAFLCSSLLFVNPVYLYLSFTYMTEPFFIACSLISASAYACSLRTGGIRSYSLGTLFVVLATLTRQVGLVIPLAYALAVVIGTRQPGRWWRAVLANVCVWLAYAAFMFWASGQQADVYGVSDLVHQSASRTALWHLSRHVVETEVTLGLLLAPLVFLLRPRTWVFTGFLLSGALSLVLLLLYGSDPAPWGNILNLNGLGPTGILGEETLPAVPRWVGWGLSFIGGGAAGSWLATVAFYFRSRHWRPLVSPQWLFLLGYGAFLVGMHVTRSPFFDRYVLLALPPVAVALGLVLQERRLKVAALVPTVACLLFFFSLAMVEIRLGLDRSRAQWALLEGFESDPASVDGGFSWNGYYYDWHTTERYSRETRRFVDDDVWRLSFEQTMPGYEPVQQARVSRPFGIGEQVLTLYRRSDLP